MTADVDAWVSVYWPGLETQLDAIDSDLYTDLKTHASTKIANYSTDHLTDFELLQAQSLLICIKAGGMPGLAGWSQERHYQTLKIDRRTWTKKAAMDHWIGELKLLLPEWTDESMASARANYFVLTRSNLAYYAPELDQRKKRPFRDEDHDLDDIIDEW